MTAAEVIAATLTEARRHVGAHYLHGAGGTAPGGHDGCFDRMSAVALHADDPDFSTTPPRRRTEPGRTLPILKAAFTDIGGVKSVCAGRSSLPEVAGRPPHARDVNNLLSQSDMARRLGSPTMYLWPRPYGTIGATTAVWGEACAGIRHFDCIMYIRYIVQYGGRVIPRNAIPSTISGWRSHSHGHVVPHAEIREGDVLIERGGHHIAIAESNNAQLNAEDTIWGVRKSGIPGDAVAVRLSDAWWMGQATGH